MAEPSWKKFERYCAELLGGQRFPANMGGPVDVESAEWLGQCKEVKTMSLESMTRLIEDLESRARARGKHGCLLLKVRRGRGRRSSALFVADATAVTQQ